MLEIWRSSILLWWAALCFLRPSEGHATVGPAGQVRLEERASLKPWIRREHEDAALELDARGDAKQAPKAIFGDPKVSPTIAKAILSAEAHQADSLTNLQTELLAQQASASTASSMLLIAEFTFFLMMLYLLNNQDVNVKRLAWSTLQSAVAIFISMLLFMSTKSAWIMLAGTGFDGTSAGVALSWTRYVVVWIVGPVLLLRRGVDDESREAWCAVVQWFTAFCAADAFGELLMLDVFKATVGAQFGGVALCSFIIWLQCFGACWARHFVVLAASEEAADGVSPREQKKKWADAWQAAETTYAGYVMGPTLSMWVRYLITGVPSHTYGRATGPSGSETGWLMLWTSLSVFIGFIVIGLVHRLNVPERSWSAQRFSQMTTAIMAMFCAWMALFSLEWEFLHYTTNSGFGGQAAGINASILLAVCASIFMFAIMRVIDAIADRTGSAAIRSTAIFCELLIGLTWQRVFYSAILLSGRQYTQSERFIDVLWMWATAAISGPAWFHFILPRFLQARKEEQEAEGSEAQEGGQATEAKEAPAPAPAAPVAEKAKENEDEEF